MHKRSLLVLLLVLVATLLASPSSSVMAQSAATEKPVMFTYVSTFEVPRANWAEFQKAETNDDAALKKLVADGTISSYGTFNRVAHQEGEPTHGDWFSATSLGNLMKALDALVGSGASRDPVYNNTKHWDYIYESRDYDLHSGTFTNAYLRVGIFKFKEGAEHAGEITRNTLSKGLEALVADGSLHGYFIQNETIHTADTNSFLIVLFTNGPEGLDKYLALISDAGKKDPAGMAGFESLVDRTGHRDGLWRVSTMTSK